ncbi:MAG: triose-phosphate isomerase [Coriobacteriia bacterium]
MDRRMMVAGNWKMYTTSGEGAVLVQDIAEELEGVLADVDVVVCPPFTGIKAVSTVIELDRVTMGLGAQDMHWEAEGAFTGAVAPRMLKELLCTHVIIGHSERREFFGETDETVNKKVHAVYAAGMQPIVCCGETLATRDAGATDEFVRAQVMAGAAGLDATQAANLVIAYEPIWAIGTGRTPTPESANDVARGIRATVGAMYGPPAAMQMRVLYGGSVKPENAKMFFREPDIDGALVGGAALKAASFADIVRAAL